MKNDTIFLDGTFDPDWYESKIQDNMNPKPVRTMICTSHKRVDLSYTKRAIWAEAMIRRGVRQSRCPVCRHYFFPEEM